MCDIKTFNNESEVLVLFTFPRDLTCRTINKIRRGLKSLAKFHAYSAKFHAYS